MSLQAFKKEIEARTKKKLTAAGFFLVSKIRESLNTAQPYKRTNGKTGVHFTGFNPSQPGTWPHKLSGQLIKSITFVVQKDVLIVGSNMAGYPKFLQTGTRHMAARPWLTLARTKYMADVMKILTK